jgi:hypothetical protein
MKIKFSEIDENLTLKQIFKQNGISLDSEFWLNDIEIELELIDN